MREAFLQFVEQNQIPTGCYKEHIRIPSFILKSGDNLMRLLAFPKVNGGYVMLLLLGLNENQMAV